MITRRTNETYSVNGTTYSVVLSGESVASLTKHYVMTSSDGDEVIIPIPMSSDELNAACVLPDWKDGNTLKAKDVSRKVVATSFGAIGVHVIEGIKGKRSAKLVKWVRDSSGFKPDLFHQFTVNDEILSAIKAM